ncbi:4-methylaminobutanoate oxidase (formaldehyde-forming) [Micromonospora sp. MH33]|uniref:NAD(P)/FAD-dependent oxidoreductase n=1 Tax=Micromonospora sp. MH33 TaxID=1945509 RepID=UPI000D147C53|nr:FAD-dependent oxidoreductase [Micromonospora sp. MH33]PSK67930.1 4-methylaminobutanoate oxidase (formaldehyde-forming) [Micromonospora sp. MH33]
MGTEVENRADVLIVGAGVIGASAAFALAKAGHDVLVVDRNSGVGDGSTGSSAGIIRVHASDAQSSALAADALAVWNNWRDFLGADSTEEVARFVRCGSLILDAGTGFVDRAAAAMRAAEVSFEEWSLDEMSGHFPYFDFHRFGPPRPVDDDEFWSEPTELLPGALYTAQSGYVGDPTLAAVNLMHAAQREGARLRRSAPVVRIDLEGARAVGATLADGSRLRAEAVLVAAGPHTDSLVTAIGGTSDFRVRTRRIREELVHVPAPAGLDLALQGVHLVDGDLNINFRPELGNAFLGGSNGDLVEEQTVIEDPDEFNPLVTADVWERTTLRLARRIPALGVPRARTGVVGLYDAAEDWLPIYDRTCFDGLFVAMATSGTQFKTAPIVGELLRHVIETELDGRDHTAEPFLAPTSGRSYSTAQFSRLRDPRKGQLRG